MRSTVQIGSFVFRSQGKHTMRRLTAAKSHFITKQLLAFILSQSNQKMQLCYM